MARIRIVDEWLRSPVSPPSRHRSIFVVASSWAEQRVLMRAFAASSDQTRPTIVLHGAELAIGPAGTDAHGEWGIHVEPPVDGRAQQLLGELELAAKRLAGTKGNPPRLMDEESPFDLKATSHWSPDMKQPNPGHSMAVPNTHVSTEPRAPDDAVHYEPSLVAPPGEPHPSAPAPAPKAYTPPTLVVPPDARGRPISVPRAAHAANRGGGISSSPAPQAERTVLTESARRTVPSGPPSAMQTAVPFGKKGNTPVPFQRSRRPTPASFAVAPAPAVGNRTQHGFSSSTAPIENPSTSSGKKAGKSRFASLVTNTMPLGFQLTDAERNVLNELGRNQQLRASQIAQIAGVGNGIAWMDALMSKLATHGLDLVVPGDDADGEPTYALRR